MALIGIFRELLFALIIAYMTGNESVCVFAASEWLHNFESIEYRGQGPILLGCVKGLSHVHNEEHLMFLLSVECNSLSSQSYEGFKIPITTDGLLLAQVNISDDMRYSPDPLEFTLTIGRHVSSDETFEVKNNRYTIPSTILCKTRKQFLADQSIFEIPCVQISEKQDTCRFYETSQNDEEIEECELSGCHRNISNLSSLAEAHMSFGEHCLKAVITITTAALGALKCDFAAMKDPLWSTAFAVIAYIHCYWSAVIAYVTLAIAAFTFDYGTALVKRMKPM